MLYFIVFINVVEFNPIIDILIYSMIDTYSLTSLMLNKLILIVL